MRREPGLIAVALDVLRARREGPAAIDRRRRERLHMLLMHARANSPFYQRHYAHLPAGIPALTDLPPVTKHQLMGSFDDWVCDPAVTLTGVREFVADTTRIGMPYLGRYFVCTSSGTTGQPGIFVHDGHACRVYHAMSYPMDLAWLSGRQWLHLLTRHARWAVVVGTGGHFAGEGWIRYLNRRHWWRRRNWKAFSLQLPLDQLVSELNAFQPAIVTSYPSALEVLATEQLSGRLRLRPVTVELGGESAGKDRRDRIAAAFGKDTVHDSYSASECLVMAFDCAQGWLHLNADWVILEPVEADYSPTPPGKPSHTVLLTNLANRVQPIVRYDLGDSVTARAEPCPCGNPLPAIRVEGRSDDVLRLEAPDGHGVSVLPLAVGSVLDETPGVLRSQLIQTGPASLTLRLDVVPGAAPHTVWDQALDRLADYLAAQGLPDVGILRAAAGPERSSSSGKFRQVIAAESTRHGSAG
jgi:phenylacetate-coenzyme A ligase PaaK-like adenylate-forming protein